MKIIYGTHVEDKEGNAIGKVNSVIRDSWTGDIRKFGIWQEGAVKDILVSPDLIHKISEDGIILVQNPDSGR